MKHQLSTLSVLHYVYGVLICLIGIAVLSVVLVGGYLGGPWLAEQSGEVPPLWLGSVISIIGWSIFFLLEVHGVLNVMSGRMIDKRKGRTFSQVIAALNCLNIPFGMALGIFTFVVLNDRDVRTEYGLAA